MTIIIVNSGQEIDKFAKQMSNMYNTKLLTMNALQLNANIYESLSIISKDETLLTKEEYLAKIDRALQQAERGDVIEFSTKEEMNEWLRSL
ncbi:MAG: hypothetical protein E7069_07490 [Bacteroidales bacterium]|nr:hypothetical protein [Bacteroidales bacterium]